MATIPSKMAWAAVAIVLGGCAFGSGVDGSGPQGGGPGDLGDAGGFKGPGDGGPLCSSDLHSVLDGNGQVVQTCPPDQACSDGMCIGSCDAVAKNHGNVGCDFVVSTPLFFNEATQGCYAVFLSNNWQKSVHIKASYGGSTLDATTFTRIPNGTPDPTTWPTLDASGLPAGGVAVLFLSSDPTSENAGTSLACKVPAAFNNATELPSNGRGKTFHFETDYPVSAYDIVPFGGAKSFLPGATMLLPTTAWGKNYIAGFPQIRVIFGLGADGGPLTMQVAASEDNTTVKVLPKDNFWGGNGIAQALPGQTTTYTLNAGEFIQWIVSSEKVSGTVIDSDKPVSLLTGSAYLCLSSKTSTGGGCDSSHQQIAPVSALGFDYAIAPFTTRRADLQDESIPYRLVGAVAGTTLTFDPPVPGAPSTIDAAAMADFEAIGAFRVTSQDKNHPFYVSQSMPGGLVTGGSRSGWTVDLNGNDGLGDEELVSVLPPQQFQSKYVFFTDPTYGTTNVVLTRVADTSGFKDVTIDCLGKIDGWKPIGGNGQFEYTNVDLLRGGTGACKNGQHTASSDGRFGLVVWGLDTWASYAYPAGGSVAPINDVVVPVTPN